ncbi:hypothetical protein [Streptomyces sp. NPDC059566]|uniref:hypothetical protein n=1 Tax=Streptomyces sp. NPDC059566 TaxID=3346866 RepID=UPI0036BB04C2
MTGRNQRWADLVGPGMNKIISRAVVTAAAAAAAVLVSTSSASADLIGEGGDVIGIASENVGQNTGNSGQSNVHSGNSAQQGFTDGSAVNVIEDATILTDPVVTS